MGKVKYGPRSAESLRKQALKADYRLGADGISYRQDGMGLIKMVDEPWENVAARIAVIVARNRENPRVIDERYTLRADGEEKGDDDRIARNRGYHGKWRY